MTTYSGTEFNDLAKLLFRCLTTSNPNFNPLTYLDTFDSLKTNLDKVNFVYQDIKKYPNIFGKYMEDIKDDNTASQHAQVAKMKFNTGNYYEALEEYTRCLASAASGLVQAEAYDKRSECLINLNMRVKCLEDISRALKLECSKEMKENLNEREKKAADMEFSEKSYYELIPNIDKNSSIQSANDCVKIEQIERFGRRIVASRDIEIGEIISLEKPFARVLTSNRLIHCHNCLNLCYNLIPCNNCTVALFCSESCKTKARVYHKYECPVLLTICYRIICEFATDDSMLLALKIALLAKDDYPQMDSSTCLKGNDYHQSVFDGVQLLANFSRFDLFHQAILTAIVFELLWNYTSFFSGIFSNSSTEDRFKEVMLTHLQSSTINAGKIYEHVEKYDFNGTKNFGYGAYPFFSSFAHSCCANVMKAYHGTKMVLRALNTIKKGEECFVNRYGLRYDTTPKFNRQQFLFNLKLLKCKCKACEEDWNPKLVDVRQICTNLEIDTMELGDIVRKVIGTDVNKAKDFLPRLIAQLKECEHSEPSGNALALKSLIAHCYVIFGNKRIEFYDFEKNVVFSL